jgi:hypothetical protein
MNAEPDQSFETTVRIDGLDVEPPQKKWFYVSLVFKDSGKFQGAVIVESENPIQAIGAAYTACFAELMEPFLARTSLEIPDEKLPGEEYRNRLLTREEVEEIWPGVKMAEDANG